MRILLAFSNFPTYSEIWSPPDLPLPPASYASLAALSKFLILNPKKTNLNAPHTTPATSVRILTHKIPNCSAPS